MMEIAYTVQIRALVNLSDPDAGIQAVTVIADDVDGPDFVECGTCQEWMSRHQRRHGHPAYRAAEQIADDHDAAWPPAKDWQAKDLRTQWGATRAERLIDEYDVARGWSDHPFWPPRSKLVNEMYPDPPGGGHDDIDQPAGPTGQEVDQRPPVKHLTTKGTPTVAEAADELRQALTLADQARARLIEALRTEHDDGNGTSANQLARDVDGLMSRPTVLQALAGAEKPPSTKGRNRLYV
jgi:hypothetical protein